jgi:hypothetical protein
MPAARHIVKTFHIVYTAKSVPTVEPGIVQRRPAINDDHAANEDDKDRCCNPRVRDHVLSLLAEIGLEVSRIYIIDDHCPENSGAWVQNHCKDRGGYEWHQNGHRSAALV